MLWNLKAVGMRSAYLTKDYMCWSAHKFFYHGKILLAISLD